MDTNEKLLFINKQSVELQWERERERDADKNEICYLLINNPSNFTGERERERVWKQMEICYLLIYNPSNSTREREGSRREWIDEHSSLAVLIIISSGERYINNMQIT
jgi:hypothetical protein